MVVSYPATTSGPMAASGLTVSNCPDGGELPGGSEVSVELPDCGKLPVGASRPSASTGPAAARRPTAAS